MKDALWQLQEKFDLVSVARGITAALAGLVIMRLWGHFGLKSRAAAKPIAKAPMMNPQDVDA